MHARCPVSLSSLLSQAITQCRDPKPVLLPEWITDSVKAGHRLPTEDYSLARLRDRPGQKALTGQT